MTPIDRREVGVAVAKGVLGAIPIVGSLAAELFGALIPNRRMDRVEQLLTEISQRLGETDSERLRERFESPEFADILEEGAVQASRALSEDRLRAIAEVLTRGITEADVKHEQDKRLLEILGELNDSEVVLLASHTIKASLEPEWLAKHERVLQPRVAYIGAPEDDVAAIAIFHR